MCGSVTVKTEAPCPALDRYRVRRRPAPNPLPFAQLTPRRRTRYESAERATRQGDQSALAAEQMLEDQGTHIARALTLGDRWLNPRTTTLPRRHPPCPRGRALNLAVVDETLIESLIHSAGRHAELSRLQIGLGPSSSRHNTSPPPAFAL